MVAFHLSSYYYLTFSLSYNCTLADTRQNGIYVFYPMTKRDDSDKRHCILVTLAHF